MASTRFLSQSLSLRQLSAHWKRRNTATALFSTINRDESSIVWPDKALGVFSQTDPRFLLPGNVGLAETGAAQTEFEASGPATVPDVLTRATRREHQIQVLYTAHDFIQFTPDADKEVCASILDRFPDMEASTLLECAVHDAPRLLKKEAQNLFVDKDLSNDALSVITLSQKTLHDMSMWSPDMEDERDRLTQHFISVAKEICARLRGESYWCDFIDPSCGLPYFSSHTNFSLMETDEKYRLLGFRIEDLGCCKVISHKAFGRNVFVGSIFTNAPSSSGVIQELLGELNMLDHQHHQPHLQS